MAIGTFLHQARRILSCSHREARRVEAVLRKLEKLELIATRSTGIDHVDAEFCKQKGITVANVPTYGDSTVAEHVFAPVS